MRAVTVSTRVRRGSAFLLVGGLALGLQGCLFESSPSLDLSLGMRSGDLVVVNCGALIGSPFEIYVTESDYPANWVILDARSAADWESGEPRGMRADDWSDISEIERARVEPGFLLHVDIYNEELSTMTTFVIPEGGIEERQWLATDGHIDSLPCG